MTSKERSLIIAALFTLVVLIAIGTIFYHSVENWSWTNSFYFSVSTITTVGYGDLYPTSDASKIFTSFYILIGVGTGLVALGIIGTDLLKRREEKIFERMLNGKFARLKKR